MNSLDRKIEAARRRAEAERQAAPASKEAMRAFEKAEAPVYRYAPASSYKRANFAPPKPVYLDVSTAKVILRPAPQITRAGVVMIGNDEVLIEGFEVDTGSPIDAEIAAIDKAFAALHKRWRSPNQS